MASIASPDFTLNIERVPEGIRIRDLARLSEARDRARRALVTMRVAAAAQEARLLSRATIAPVVVEGFTAAERAWFRRPLSSEGDTFPGL